MTPLDVLKRFKEYTEQYIAPHLSMRKEPVLTGDVMDLSEEKVEYVKPSVCYGTIPHKNFQPFLDFQVPMILWTFDEVDDTENLNEGRTVNLRAYVAAYSSETYQGEDSKLPDNKAFVDLANALEKMYIEITRRNVINGVGIKKPINYGIYDGVHYPYAYGWLTVTAEIERMQYDDGIDLDEI